MWGFIERYPQKYKLSTCLYTDKSYWYFLDILMVEEKGGKWRIEHVIFSVRNPLALIPYQTPFVKHLYINICPIYTTYQLYLSNNLYQIMDNFAGKILIFITKCYIKYIKCLEKSRK